MGFRLNREDFIPTQRLMVKNIILIVTAYYPLQKELNYFRRNMEWFFQSCKLLRHYFPFIMQVKLQHKGRRVKLEA